MESIRELFFEPMKKIQDILKILNKINNILKVENNNLFYLNNDFEKRLKYIYRKFERGEYYKIKTEIEILRDKLLCIYSPFQNLKVSTLDEFDRKFESEMIILKEKCYLKLLFNQILKSFEKIKDSKLKLIK